MLIQKLHSQGAIDTTGHALDLGCGTGTHSRELIELGYTVDSVDRIDSPNRYPLLNFYQSDIREFKIGPKKYDLIICNNVLSFISDKDIVFKLLSDMINGLTNTGKIYFTVFGHNDAWAKRDTMSFFDFEEVKAFLKKSGLILYNESTEEGYGPMMNGDMKYWHIHKYLYTR